MKFIKISEFPQNLIFFSSDIALLIKSTLLISLIHLLFTEFVDILTVKLAEWLENLFSLHHLVLIWMQVDAVLNDRSAESINQFWSNDREWIKEEAV